jgi:hypothetical protein
MIFKNIFQLFILTFTIIVMLSSCSSSVPKIIYKVKENQDGIKTRFIDGDKIATSTKPSSTVLMKNINKYKYGSGFSEMNYYVINIDLINNSDQEINLIPENIVVNAFDNVNNMKTLKIYKPDEFLKLARKVQGRSRMIYALASSASNSNAGKTTSSTNASSNTSINGSSRTTGSLNTNTGLYATGQSQTQLQGNVNSRGASRTTTIDYDAKNRAKKQSDQKISDAYKAQEKGNDEVVSEMLKANTLFPGQKVVGKIFVEYIAGYDKSLAIKIPFSNDTHEIHYSVIN